MLYSRIGKFIFIANPKTGTTSFQSAICEIDESASKNHFNGIAIQGHDTANDILKKIGIENFQKNYKIAFIRNPYDKCVSGYYFYKNGNPLTRGGIFKYMGSLDGFIKAVITQLNIFIANLIPFKIWSLIYPVKKNTEYITNEDGVFLVDFICKTESIEEDLRNVFHEIEYPFESLFKLPHINRSNHRRNSLDYFRWRFHRYLFEKKNAKEIRIYKSLKRQSPTLRLYGRNASDFLDS